MRRAILLRNLEAADVLEQIGIDALNHCSGGDTVRHWSPAHHILVPLAVFQVVLAEFALGAVVTVLQSRRLDLLQVFGRVNHSGALLALVLPVTELSVVELLRRFFVGRRGEAVGLGLGLT